MPASDPFSGTPDDAALMAATGRGDADAFARLVHRHHPVAWRLACRFLGDPAEAEDIVQEAFLKILHAAARYRPTASFRTYLHTVVARLCLDHTRRKRPDYSGDLPDPPSEAPDPAESLDLAEQRLAIRRALDDLPPAQRLAILLQHDEGLDYATIARIMGISVRAVEGCIRRGRAGLADRLGRTFGPNNRGRSE
jgi:RNA polymerase sigma-70 factor (ECF subfamily)